MILAKNYFEPINEGEDYFYHVDSDQNIKYETLESIYNQFFTKQSCQEAKDISLYVRNKNKYIDKSLTYGEVTFRSMAYIFEYCKSRYDINEEGNFFDLGSGIGCGVLAAVLCFNFKKYIGIEFIQALNKKAEKNKNIFMEKFQEIHKQYNDYLPEYIFDENLKNEIVIEIKKEEKKKKEKKNQEKEEDKMDHQEKLKNYMIESQNPDHNLKVLEMIYGQNFEQDNEEGYMSYAKKLQKRNEEFFEEYERKLKITEKEKEEQKKKLEAQPGYIRRGSVHSLLHGKNSIFEKLGTENKKETEKEKEKERKKRLTTLHKKKEGTEDKDSDEGETSSEKTIKQRIITPSIEFICGNFMNIDLTKASFIFCNSTCFSSELLLNIAKKVSKEAPTGCIVITFTKKLPFLDKNEWEIKQGFKRLMSWGLATVFVHRKNKSTKAKNSENSGTSDDSKSDSTYTSKTSEVSGQ